MEEKEESFATRLSKALILRNMRPIDLANKSGINKATISEYLKGKYEAKQNNIYILAKTLDVNEAWLMGFNVGIDRVPDSERDQIMACTIEDDSMLPLLGKEDIAYVLPQEDYISGETIYFWFDNKKYIRKVVENNDVIEFQAMNPYYPVIKCAKSDLKKKEFIVIGKVIKVENKSAFK